MLRRPEAFDFIARFMSEPMETTENNGRQTVSNANARTPLSDWPYRSYGEWREGVGVEPTRDVYSPILDLKTQKLLCI